LGTHGGCCLDHVLQRWDDLLPVSGLETTIRVYPDVLALGVQDLAVHVTLQLLNHELHTADTVQLGEVTSKLKLYYANVR
jgi:hypothetical protein